MRTYVIFLYYYSRHALLEQILSLILLTHFIISLNLYYLPVLALLFLSHCFRRCVTCNHFVYTKTRTYTEAKSLFSPLTNLTYINNIPVLTIQPNDFNPYRLGYEQGHILGSYLDKYLWKIESLSKIMNLNTQHDFHIPKKYEDEMYGFVDGYIAYKLIDDIKNRLNRKYNRERLYNLILLLNMLPDLGDRFGVACSCLLKRENNTLKFGRNLDWCPYGDLPIYTLVIKRRDTYSLCIPGMIGVTTGWNSKGLTLAMNVSPKVKREKISDVPVLPSTFLNRLFLDECGIVREVRERFCDTLLNGVLIQGIQTLTPYQITIADEKEDCCSIYTGSSSIFRELSRDNTLIVTNFGYTTRMISSATILRINSYITPQGDHFNSRERMGTILQGVDDGLGVEEIMGSFPVNNHKTCYTLIFTPKERRVEISWDNGFSGSMKGCEMVY